MPAVTILFFKAAPEAVKLPAKRVRPEPHAQRSPQRGHAVRITGSVRQAFPFVYRESVVGKNEVDVRPAVESVSESVGEREEWIDVALARRQLRSAGVLLQVLVHRNSAIELDDLMESDARAGMEPQD